MVYSTSLNDFKQLIQSNQKVIEEKGALVPVIEECLADMVTPVSVFSQIKDNCGFKNVFILESVDSETQSGRYSFIGFNPFLNFIIENSKYNLTVNDNKFDEIAASISGLKHPLSAFKKLLNAIEIVHLPKVPRLVSGAVGYLGYDTIRLVENIPFDVEKDQNIPMGILGFYNTLIIFDNFHKTMMYVYAPFISGDDNIETTFKEAREKLKELSGLFLKKSTDDFKPEKQEVKWQSNMTPEQYKNNVDIGKEYIKAGDIFQVVLSQRFNTNFDGDPFHLYRALRIINPSPYLYYIDFDDVKIIGSSPELLVRIDEGRVYTRPIAGTRPRGKNAQEDTQFEEDLMADKKELAEHLMLVDLGRNDLGKVCKFGSVQVSRMMKVERYSHVMHIVSDVDGELDTTNSPVDVLYSAFPAGTLSGAPKIRAMEIIDELEPTERSVYGGAIGYFDFGGNMDWCIAIRTIVLKDNNLSIQAGAGIAKDLGGASTASDTALGDLTNMQADANTGSCDLEMIIASI